VSAAFGLILNALFGTAGGGSTCAAGTEDRVIVNLLVEHSKTGRLVGAKGCNIQNLKLRSGASVRVDKEPLVSSRQLLTAHQLPR
jgi:hypothetical protein